MVKLPKQFLIVDDDILSNFLSKKALEKSLGDVDVRAFIVPELALSYLETEFEPKQLQEKTILLLDINMPTLTGWEFIDKFNTLRESIKNKFNIYMLSSSIDPVDIERARLNPLVTNYLEKPLNKVILTKMFS